MRAEMLEQRTSGFDHDPMTVVLWNLGMNGDPGDQVTDGMGSGASRYGRRIVEWDDSGNVQSERFNTEKEAIQELARLARWWYDDDDE